LYGSTGCCVNQLADLKKKNLILRTTLKTNASAKYDTDLTTWVVLGEYPVCHSKVSFVVCLFWSHMVSNTPGNPGILPEFCHVSWKLRDAVAFVVIDMIQ